MHNKAPHNTCARILIWLTLLQSILKFEPQTTENRPWKISPCEWAKLMPN